MKPRIGRSLTLTWPADRVVPQASIEVEDADAVAAAGSELERAGFELLHPARTGPWGQTVTRLLTDDGLIIDISYAPSFTTKNPPELRVPRPAPSRFSAGTAR